MSEQLKAIRAWLVARGHTVVDGRITQRAAAQYIGIDTRTLRRWGEEGVGPPATKIGPYARARYRLEDLAAWIEQQNPDKADNPDKAGGARRA